MPITAGDFSAAQLGQAMVAADKMFKDSQLRPEFEANADVVKALKAEQTADVSILEDGEKDRDVKVYWVNSCATAVADCAGDDCDLSGGELGTDSKVYSLGVCKETKFTVDELGFRNSHLSFEEVVAKGFLKADKALSEAIAAIAVSKIEAFRGTNTVTNGVGTPNAGTGDTDVASADWNERLFAYLNRVGIQNQMGNAFLLSGSNLYEDRLVSLLAEANANGKGAALLFKTLRTYFDLFNIDSVNTPKFKSYLIDRGAIAFASKHYYSTKPVRYKTQDRFSVQSRNIPGLWFDVFYTNRCSTTKILHDWMFKAKFDFFLNPTGCDATRTGVLSFNKT